MRTKLPTESWADIAQVYTSHINARSVIRVLDVHIAFGDTTLYIQTRGPISASTVENPLMIVGIVVNMEDSMNHLSSSANLKAKELGMQISLLVPHALHGLLLFRIVMQVRMSQKTAGFVKDHSVGKHSKTTMRRVHAY